jgi:exodeoxyribonuclease VII small subunit
MTVPEGTNDSPESDSLSFEEAYRRLNEMAESLEEGGVSLSDAMSRYEEGMELVRLCNRLLDEAELRITNLRDSFSSPSADIEDSEDDLPF